MGEPNYTPMFFLYDAFFTRVKKQFAEGKVPKVPVEERLEVGWVILVTVFPRFELKKHVQKTLKLNSESASLPFTPEKFSCLKDEKLSFWQGISSFGANCQAMLDFWGLSFFPPTICQTAVEQ